LLRFRQKTRSQWLPVRILLQNFIELYQSLSHALTPGAEIESSRRQGELMPSIIGVSISLRAEELP
jgi:hypothetical protein